MIGAAGLTYGAAQRGQRNGELRTVRAFKQGMAPLVGALLAIGIIAPARRRRGPVLA